MSLNVFLPFIRFSSFFKTISFSGPEYLKNPRDATSMAPMHVKEECNVCSRIVNNSFKWNWKPNYSALCNLIPDHLMEDCKHLACKMASTCPEFISGTCADLNGRILNPCPAK